MDDHIDTFIQGSSDEGLGWQCNRNGSYEGQSWHIHTDRSRWIVMLTQ